MKKLILLLVGLTFTIACKQAEPKSKTISVTKTEKTVLNISGLMKNELKITGMVCAIGCAGAIEKKLNTTVGVQSAKVYFEEGIAQIIFDPNQIKSKELNAIVKSVGDAYDVIENTEVEEFKLHSEE